MNKVKLLDTCFLRTGKLDSNCATENGKYPFFTCAPTPLKIDEFAFDEDAILLAGNNAQGNFHIQRFTGKFNAYQRTYVITAKNGWDIDYIKYSIEIALNHLKRMAQGSQTKFLTLGMLESFYLKDISLQEQKKTIRLLKAVDQKISLNNRINDNLQRQLKLLYDYWFTQFDFPDETGRPYRTSGGKMQIDPTLRRPIPVGWEVETLKNNRLASLIPTGVERFQTKIYYATADVIGMDIGNGSPIAYETRENRANMQPTMFSVWFAKMKKSIKHLFLNREMQDFIQNSILSTGFCGLQCTENYFEYVASFIEHSYFEATKDVYAHGATQEAVNNGDLAKIVFIVPPEDVLLAYHEKTKHLYSQISHNKMENKKLIDLRDWLLPLLMNGQATLAD